MTWNNADELTNAIEELETTVHAGAPIAFSVRHCFAMVSDVVDLVWPEIERLRAAIDGIRWVLDGEHGTMRHTTFARLDADECREIAELLAVYPPPQENDR